MRLLFLDVDGVLNDHKPFPSGFNGISYEMVGHLSRILTTVPDVQIVLSSAWRYWVAGGDITLKGFEGILLIHGAAWEAVNGRIHGMTDSDEETCWVNGLWPRNEPIPRDFLKENGELIRALQIETAIDRIGAIRAVTLDDLELPHLSLVRTQRDVGLTSEIADTVIERFNR